MMWQQNLTEALISEENTLIQMKMHFISMSINIHVYKHCHVQMKNLAVYVYMQVALNNT
jgi:hypothetical protein